MHDPASTQHQPRASEARSAALRGALAKHNETLIAAAAEADRNRAAGCISAAAHRDQLHTAHAAYDRDCALAELAADTGWETWTGVGGLVYARRPRSSPPKVVRAPSAQALREAIGRDQDGTP